MKYLGSMRRGFDLDLRSTPLAFPSFDVPSFEVRSYDSVSVMFEVELSVRIANTARAALAGRRFLARKNGARRSLLRSLVVRGAEIRPDRARLGADLCDIFARRTHAWGIGVTVLAIPHVALTDNMVVAIACEAAAARRAISQPMTVETTRPLSMRVRYVQSLTEFSVANATTVVFPMPIGIVGPALALLGPVPSARAPRYAFPARVLPAPDCGVFALTEVSGPFH